MLGPNLKNFFNKKKIINSVPICFRCLFGVAFRIHFQVTNLFNYRSFYAQKMLICNHYYYYYRLFCSFIFHDENWPTEQKICARASLNRHYLADSVGVMIVDGGSSFKYSNNRVIINNELNE